MAIEKYGRCPCDDSWGSQKYKSSHKALDFGFLSKYGANRPVKAWKSGVVVAAGTDSAGGVYVVLQHDDDYTWFTGYWHLKKGSIAVKKGEIVVQGQQVGIRGNTGISTGVHLHFIIAKCKKGTKYSYNTMIKNSVDPTNITYIFEGQTFNQNGDFKLNKKPEEVVEPIPVARNENVHQSEVIADKLRARLAPSTSAANPCYAKKGIYNVIEISEANGYTWFKIDNNYWVATKEGEWTIDLPIKNPVKTLEEQIAAFEKELKKAEEALTVAQTELSSTKQQLAKTEEALKVSEKKINDVKNIVNN